MARWRRVAISAAVWPGIMAIAAMASYVTRSKPTVRSRLNPCVHLLMRGPRGPDWSLLYAKVRAGKTFTEDF